MGELSERDALHAQQGQFATSRGADKVDRAAASVGCAPSKSTIKLPRPTASKERLRLQLYASLLLLDLACLASGFLLANYVRFGELFGAPGLACIPLSAVLYVILAFSGRAYSVEVLESPATSVGRGVQAIALTAAALLVVFFSLKSSAQISRAVLVGGFCLGLVLLGLARYAFAKVVGRRYGWNFIREVLIIDGINVLPRRGQVVLFAEPSVLSPFLNDPSAFDALGRLLSNCDRVILASDPSRRQMWGETLKGAGIPVEVLAPELDDLGAFSIRRTAAGTSVLIAPGPMGLRDRLLKRGLDLAVTLPAALVLAPVLIAAALAIKLTSPGPVFFRQPRIGQANRHFDMLKFRSMRVQALDTAGSRSTSKDDDRITTVGLFLRKTSLDELPQLLNVLKGEMSIVGPRPHALSSTAEDRLFWEIDGRYWQRGSVKPGMTGLAQVRGYRGATHRIEDLTNRLQADLEYLTEWSIWKDIAIIFKTAKVLVHPNAY